MHLPGYGIAAADCRQEHDSANKFSMQTAAWVRFAFVRIARMRSRPKSHDVACSEPAMKNSNLYVFSTLMGLVLLSITPLLRAADWSRLKSADVARSEASFLVYEGGVFSFNGFDGNIDIENSVERYDLADNSWEIVANSTTSGSAPSAVTHNGLVIVDDEAWFIGGRIGNSPGRVTDSVAIFDLENYQWRNGPELPLPFAAGGAAVVNKRIHVFGGVDAQSRCDVDTHLMYDLNAPGRGWQDLSGSAPFPLPRNHFGTVEMDGLIYAVGGQKGHDNCSTQQQQRVQLKYIHSYDPATNNWSRLDDLPWAQSHIEPSIFVHDGRIWSAGGKMFGKRVMSYEPAADEWTWREDLDLPTALFAPGARIFNGNRLHVFGGGAPNVRNPKRDIWVTTVPDLEEDSNNTTLDDATSSVSYNGGNGDASDNSNDAVYRINVGGPEIDDKDSGFWSADNSANGLYTSTGSRIWNTKANATTSVAGTAPPATIYKTTRTNFSSAEGLGWSLPITPGEYEVRLYVAEMWQGAFNSGVRLFDVEVEGRLVDTSVDLYGRFGARRGSVLSYRISSDQNLEIVLHHVQQNPAIQGLEIIAVGTGQDNGNDDTGGVVNVDEPTGTDGSGGSIDDNGGTQVDTDSANGNGDTTAQAELLADELDLTFGGTMLDESNTLNLELRNPGTRTLNITDVFLSGDDSMFDIELDNTDSLVAGEVRVVAVTFTPDQIGDADAILAIGHDGVDGVLLLALEGAGLARVDGTGDGTLSSLWRINIGGEAMLGSDGMVWQGDTSDVPQGYLHEGSRRYTTMSSVGKDNSVPANAPVSLFKSERWTSNRRDGLSWRFPVEPGRYEVRLFFAEIYTGAFDDGARLFDVVIEGESVLEALDVFSEAGSLEGIMKRFVLDSDAMLDISLHHVAQNPTLKGIEILKCETQCDAD